MITELKLNKIATYKTETTISNLKKVNFFFGYNGTGKSTIGKHLYNGSLNEDKKNEDFKFCSILGYDKKNHEILVFNQQFIERNFIQKNIQKGIFSLNETNQEIDSLIAEKQSLLKLYEHYHNKIIEENDQIIKLKENEFQDLKRKCFEERKTTINSFFKIRDSFLYKQTQNNFDQIKFTLENNFTANHIDFEDLSHDYKQYYDTDILNIPLYISPFLYKKIRNIENSINISLQEIIIGNKNIDINKLISDLNIRKNWVEEGLNYLSKDEEIQACPFCQQETIDKKLIEKFENYFDETYKSKINNITALKTQYIDQIDIILDDIKAIQNYFNSENNVSNLYDNLKTLFNNNIKIIVDKIASPNEIKTIESIYKLKKQISEINKDISANNLQFENLENNKVSFIENIWSYLAQNCKESIERYNKQVAKYTETFFLNIQIENRIQYNISQTKIKIEEWKGKTVTTKEAIDNINKILKYSGFDNFYIKETEIQENNISQYILKRHENNLDNVFSTLSEGEKNFIAFLYFYQLCLGTNDQDSTLRKKIIVIDDPVSSLDNQVLFIVTTLIHKLIEKKGNKPEHRDLKNPNIIQVFILSHNIYFHKEISLDYRPICYDKSFYHINKKNNMTTIDCHGEKNNILNDYSLLWNSLIKLKNENNDTLNIAICNIMRRIIESYVNFTKIGKDSWAVLTKIPIEDPRHIICSALISEINDGSHKISPLDDMYFQRIISTSPQNLFDSFELVFKEISESHYNAMMA
ncbi:AAA family ATPase [Elizabethkingia anophelis]|uniref:AAA family ATPase n=1 Tax=Elizabethkingia anophelis TaxID=1117645 RepID=UPI00084094F3|nr:AAA family ATPase [Elizabethkingia anophelis]OCW73220.1 hypothetical protein A4G24_16220 [Elizabethkingia anophelis]